MKKVAGLVLFALFLGTLAPSAFGQLIVNPTGKASDGAFEAGGLLWIGEVDYDADGDVTVERTVLGVGVAYGLDPMIDIYGAIGTISKAEIDTEIEGFAWDDEGDGYMMAVGIRGQAAARDAINFFAYGQLQHISEDYGELNRLGVTVSTEADIQELIVGAGAKHAINEQFSLYGAAELVPYSSGDGEAEITGVPDKVSDSSDVERDSVLGVRIGSLYQVDRWAIRGEFALIAEQSFSLGAAYAF